MLDLNDERIFLGFLLFEWVYMRDELNFQGSEDILPQNKNVSAQIWVTDFDFLWFQNPNGLIPKLTIFQSDTKWESLPNVSAFIHFLLYFIQHYNVAIAIVVFQQHQLFFAFLQFIFVWNTFFVVLFKINLNCFYFLEFSPLTANNSSHYACIRVQVKKSYLMCDKQNHLQCKLNWSKLCDKQVSYFILTSMPVIYTLTVANVIQNAII